jgi:hypothetical protein
LPNAEEPGLNQLVHKMVPIIESANTIRHVVIPGVVTFSAVSIGYLLFFSRALYASLASLLGVKVGWQKLDPAMVLESWERENKKRVMDEREKRIEGMFG